MNLIKLPYIPCIILLALLAFGCAENRQDTAAGVGTGANDSIRIGHVDMELLFQSYAKTGEFYRRAEDIQLKFEELEEDDFEQMMQLQGEFQFLQMELFQSFQDDVEETAKTVSESMGLDVIAVEVLYRSEKAEIIDVTHAFIETDFFTEGHIHSEDCDHD